MIFGEACHSCGGCMLVCPENAIKEVPKPVGILETGYYKNIKVVTGILNPGEASGVPVIREALKAAEGTTIIDCPPGSACSVMESVMDADFCVLVAEPTAFGFHNFQMVYELVTLLHKKCGVVINKQETPYEPLERFCQERQIPVLAVIPYRQELASAISAGEVACEKVASPGRAVSKSFTEDRRCAMKRLLILSGKGGTGKTTVAASFVRFAQAKAAADCDVDAPNLHLVFPQENAPEISEFAGGDKAVIDAQKCIGCGLCQAHCRFHAIEACGDKFAVNEYSCEGCGGMCVYL